MRLENKSYDRFTLALAFRLQCLFFEIDHDSDDGGSHNGDGGGDHDNGGGGNHDDDSVGNHNNHGSGARNPDVVNLI